MCKRIDVMLDIETLGTAPESTVFQIGAVVFDICGGDIISDKVFNADISKGDICASGSTLRWWLNTDSTLFRQILNDGTDSPSEMMSDFHWWLASMCSNYDVHLWGNGILFDNNIIRKQMEMIGKDYPIHYRNDRDLRTLVDIASYLQGTSYKEFVESVPRQGRHHDALSDAYLQVEVAIKAWKLIAQRDK